jgi:hypothetical protein
MAGQGMDLGLGLLEVVHAEERSDHQSDSQAFECYIH